ncbi:MAG: hypothetical protein A3F84_21430 [Candidatus Handelsmanbacteria bacterium RIFCSPLOWO2_12_FULL_64_10]|uniref:Methyltransferase domain-containing protein n=1 Tax=Handelsmanbacteria sp. (strain RIFCSPLOWO2_12_FULL_64_10) TaxID=1817868 RepID=A0A1F6CBX7_HANXR|nr:MAG: hypothetical protein A3F84_21430 [Candidatus Handelsmanbacteria bacterium RIFCSPLOWO2_12_FULL_64_10]
MQDPYSEFALRYDLFSDPFGQANPTEASFLGRLFDQKGVRRVLDCACGTGQHLHLMHELGRECVGSDISEAMLKQATATLWQRG